MIKIKDNVKSIIIIGAVSIIFSICVIQLKEIRPIISTMAVTENNKVIGWGIKRAENNLQPDVGELNKKY